MRTAVEQELDGNSLKPLLMNHETAWDKPVLMSHGPGNFAVRLGRWRLIHYADGSEELYDMKADPGEFSNLAAHAAHDAAREKLRKHLPTTWRYIMGRRFETFSDSFARPSTADQ